MHKLLKIAVILAILIEKVKLFGIYFALRRFDFNILGTLYYELLLTVGIKEKEREYRGSFLVLFVLGSIIQKILIR